jgi:hypothetical protein
MQVDHPGFEEFEDDMDPKTPRKADPEPLRILARWIAMHDGTDPSSGAVIDRDFVVLDPTLA